VPDLTNHRVLIGEDPLIALDLQAEVEALGGIAHIAVSVPLALALLGNTEFTAAICATELQGASMADAFDQLRQRGVPTLCYTGAHDLSCPPGFPRVAKPAPAPAVVQALISVIGAGR
jgi:pimeloyl-ACP methyl ester carboxylesterase